ncbi:MAG TPA: hypothetical protein VI636_14860 [Candidatus Angelobacter sp.]
MQTLKFTRADDQPANGTGLEGEPKLDLSHLLGTWWSTDKATRGIRKLVLSEENGTLMVHGFGACLPELCDWGKVPAVPYAANVTSREAMSFTSCYDFGFMETTLAVYMKGGILVLDSFNAFKDSSGRSDYFTREFYHT